MIIHDFDDVLIHRFFCQCGSAQHVMEITVDEDNEIAFEYYHGRCNFNLWERIKAAADILFLNKVSPWCDFIVREEDREKIVELLRRSDDQGQD